MLKIIFLILSLFVLGNCTSNAPIDYVYIIDVKHMVCNKYKITDKSKFTVIFDSSYPIISCDGFPAIATSDYLPLKQYIIKQEASCKGN